jgi:hypothetical protein
LAIVGSEAASFDEFRYRLVGDFLILGLELQREAFVAMSGELQIEEEPGEIEASPESDQTIRALVTYFDAESVTPEKLDHVVGHRDESSGRCTRRNDS